jgi:hypothetical protein
MGAAAIPLPAMTASRTVPRPSTAVAEIVLRTISRASWWRCLSFASSDPTALAWAQSSLKNAWARQRFSRPLGRASERGRGTGATIVPWLVQKMRQALTFLATIENDHHGMKTLAVISILALLTISGAAYTDQLLTSDQQTMQRAD